MMDEVYPWPLKGLGAVLMRHLLGREVADLLDVPELAWTQEQLFRVQQKFYAGMERAADSSELVRRVQRALSQNYLNHIKVADRGPGSPKLCIPEQLDAAWQRSAPMAVAATGGMTWLQAPAMVPVRAIEHPVERNHQINQSYHQLSIVMGQYLGTPRIADWCTFAKFASHQAGEHIRETSITAKELLHNLLDFSVPGKLRRLMDDLTQLPGRMGMARLLLRLMLGRSDLDLQEADVSRKNGARVLPALCELRAASARLNRSFILGNLYIYENIFPAYLQFLAAARGTADGVMETIPALADDPHGYLRRAFECYREARRCYLAQQELKRDEWVHKGNLWIGLHEQGHILQPLFDEVRAELSVLSSAIFLRDPHGQHQMLPLGGDWGELVDRMGIDRQGKKAQPWSELPPLLAGSAGTGTIGGYFTARLHDPKLIETAPADIFPMGKALGELLEEERGLF